MSNPDADQVANRLFFRLFQTGNTLQRQVQNEMGISTVQWSVLGALSRQSAETGMSFNQLTTYLLVSRQSLDGVLKRLERDGHVQRIPHPDDGRARLVQLTEGGHAFWNGLQERIYHFYNQALAGFNLDDSTRLMQALDTLQAGLMAVRLGDDSSVREYEPDPAN